MNATGFEEYTPFDAVDAVQRAVDFFHAHDDLWDFPLFFALSDPISTHGGVWAERCIAKMLPLCHTPHLSSLCKDFEYLKELRSQLAPREEFAARAQEIWYRHPARDWIQTAMSRLYGGVAHDLYRNGDGHDLIDFGGAVNLLAKGEEYPESFLLIATEEFEFVLERRRRGVRPSELLGLRDADHYGYRYRSQVDG
jgi:hypothetical protein